MEMYQPKEDRLREFWRALQEFWLHLYGSRLPVIAAINVCIYQDFLFIEMNVSDQFIVTATF